MSANSAALRDLVVERMVVAADEIFALFEQAFAEYQETVRSKLLQDHKYHVEKNPNEELQKDIRTVVVQTDEHQKFDCIKNEEEEIPLGLQFRPVTAASADNISKSIFYEPEPSEEQAQIKFEVEEFEGEEYREEKYETEDYPAEEYEGEKPVFSLGSDQDPNCFSDTDDSEDWRPLPKKKRKSRKRSQNRRKSNESPGNASSIDREQLETIIRSSPFISTKVKSFSCSLCNNSFSAKCYLRQHMRVHTGERPFRCEPCGVTFRFQQNLRQHDLAVHAKERPHRCRVCHQEFADVTEFIAHKETHKDKEPYRCLNCNKTFTCIKSLMSHKMSQRCL